MGGTENNHKEWLSRAFVMAIAATAGYTVQLVQDDVDGVDVVVRDGGVTVDVQLKATAVPKMENGTLKFDLDVKTYEKLRIDRNSPGYLVVAVIPKARDKWIGHFPNHIRLRRMAYWLKITGMPPATNASWIRLHIPLENEVTNSALQDIVADARRSAMA